MGDEKNKFDELESELRAGLFLREAPLGFATRVMAQVDATKPSPSRLLFWRWATATALLVVLVAAFAGTRWQQQREERIAGEHARDQVILALRITGSTLAAVREKVQQSGNGVQP